MQNIESIEQFPQFGVNYTRCGNYPACFPITLKNKIIIK